MAYKDCQPFCSAAFRDDHCEVCKCKACGFCACSSDQPGDSTEEMCEPWCSAEFEESHCAACKCRACSFCKQGKE